MISLVMSVDINDPPLCVCDQVMVPVQTVGQLSQTFLQLVGPAVWDTLQSGLQSSDLATDCLWWLRPFTRQTAPGGIVVQRFSWQHRPFLTQRTLDSTNKGSALCWVLKTSLSSSQLRRSNLGNCTKLIFFLEISKPFLKCVKLGVPTHLSILSFLRGKIFFPKLLRMPEALKKIGRKFPNLEVWKCPKKMFSYFL